MVESVLRRSRNKNYGTLSRLPLADISRFLTIRSCPLIRIVSTCTCKLRVKRVKKILYLLSGLLSGHSPAHVCADVLPREASKDEWEAWTTTGTAPVPVPYR